MSTNYLQCLSQIATYLKVPPGRLFLEDNMIPVRVSGDQTTKGFSNIINELIGTSRSHLTGTSRMDKVEVSQWIEYSMLFVAQCVSSQNVQQIMLELDEVLASKTYLVAHKMSIADILLYYVMGNFMHNISSLDKEKYLNVSRWFDNMQQDASVRQKNKMIDFKTNYLVAVAPARH